MGHVLITRTEPDATKTAARVAALGLVPIIAPIFHVSVRDPALPSAGDIIAVVLTSRNAVPACLPGLVHKPAFAVGPATALRAAEAGFRTVFNADGNAEALAGLITRELQVGSGTLFLPTARGQGIQLSAALRNSGFRVLRRVAYEVIGTPALPRNAVAELTAGRVAHALFFSTESARHFVRLTVAAELEDAARNIEAVSISESPMMALKRLPWRRISVAAKPNQDAMLALLQ